jgi:hypothetical protein
VKYGLSENSAGRSSGVIVENVQTPSRSAADVAPFVGDDGADDARCPAEAARGDRRWRAQAFRDGDATLMLPPDCARPSSRRIRVRMREV